jgi:hypothetical protein
MLLNAPHIIIGEGASPQLAIDHAKREYERYIKEVLGTTHRADFTYLSHSLTKNDSADDRSKKWVFVMTSVLTVQEIRQ